MAPVSVWVGFFREKTLEKFRDKILMCPPDFFTVEYVINPWMAGHESSLDIDVAKKQWVALKDVISEVADVVTMDPQPDLPDMVFTANAGAVYGNKAIASHFMPHDAVLRNSISRSGSEITYLIYWISTKNWVLKGLAIACWTAVGHGCGRGTDFEPRSKRTKTSRRFSMLIWSPYA